MCRRPEPSRCVWSVDKCSVPPPSVGCWQALCHVSLQLCHHVQDMQLPACSSHPMCSCSRAGLYFTLPGDRERSRSLGRNLAYNMSDANLCELGKVTGMRHAPAASLVPCMPALLLAHVTRWCTIDPAPAVRARSPRRGGSPPATPSVARSAPPSSGPATTASSSPESWHYHHRAPAQAQGARSMAARALGGAAQTVFLLFPRAAPLTCTPALHVHLAQAEALGCLSLV